MRNNAKLFAGLLAAAPLLAFVPAAEAANTAAGGTTATQVQIQKNGPSQEIARAVNVINKMKADPKLAALMKKAKGIFVVPEFGRGALVVGARGGSGVMLAKTNGLWGNPAFYNMGGISVGAQAGGSGGAIAFLLMSRSAVNAFHSQNSFSLNAGAGLSIVNYSAASQASWGKGDIILWSNTKGLFAGAQISVTDIMWDGQANQAYYGKKVTPNQVLAGAVISTHKPRLRMALSNNG
jgi:SH3 domain-containing YSC84-like protein 1